MPATSVNLVNMPVLALSLAIGVVSTNTRVPGQECQVATIVLLVEKVALVGAQLITLSGVTYVAGENTLPMAAIA